MTFFENPIIDFLIIVPFVVFIIWYGARTKMSLLSIALWATACLFAYPLAIALFLISNFRPSELKKKNEVQDSEGSNAKLVNSPMKMLFLVPPIIYIISAYITLKSDKGELGLAALAIMITELLTVIFVIPVILAAIGSKKGSVKNTLLGVAYFMLFLFFIIYLTFLFL